LAPKVAAASSERGTEGGRIILEAQQAEAILQNGQVDWHREARGVRGAGAALAAARKVAN
jgi:hypothetical protein